MTLIGSALQIIVITGVVFVVPWALYVLAYALSMTP